MPIAQKKIPAKDKILAAAVTLFARLGYEGASFAEITELCGAKRSLILYHYGSKEELWRAAVESVSRRFDDEMGRRLQIEADAPDEAKMRASMTAFLDTLVAVPEFGQILLREGTAPGPRLDWLAANFAPPVTLTIRFKDPALERRMKRSILRDVITATFLATVVLGPLLEASLAAAQRRANVGVYPLTPEKRDEIVAMMMTLALG
jgi:AcrR family transcriptional regulator